MQLFYFVHPNGLQSCLPPEEYWSRILQRGPWLSIFCFFFFNCSFSIVVFVSVYFSRQLTDTNWHSHDMISRLLSHMTSTPDVDLDYLPGQAFTRIFCHINWLHFLLLTVLFGRKLLYSAYRYRVESCVPPPWGCKSYIHHREYFCTG